MAAAGQMAEFFATLGFKVDKNDIKKVDKTLEYIEKRVRKVVEGDLANMKVGISGFRFTNGFNTRLYKAMQGKMKVLNNKKGLSPEITISKFDVDKSVLLREMKDAVNYVEQNLRVKIRSDVERPAMGGRGSGGAATGGVSRFGTGMGVGAAAGSLGRGFIPGLGLAFGVSQMNKINQELIGQNLAATAVFGSEEAGKEQLDWVRNLGNKIGFDYRSQANPYMKMAAAGTTAGMGTEDVQDIFTGMAEYGRVMGLNDEDMKGSMRAVEQMLNKGQVYAEELKMQLGEKFPAAIQLMAEAVSGGDTEKLFDMMEKGEVSSIEALPKFAEILSRQARRGGALNEAMKTSLAEQMRFNNTFNDLVMFLSEAGFEEGQAGIFRTMADFFKEMKPLLTAFGEAWTYVADLLRVPLGLFVDLGRAIEGISDYTGIAKGKILGFGLIIAGLAIPFTRVFTAVSIAFALLEDFTAFLSGRGSLTAQLLGDDSDMIRDKFLNVFKSSITVVGTLTDRVKDLFDILNGQTDLDFVKDLNEFLTDLNRFLDDLNVLLGGKTRAERNLDAAIAGTTNPHLRNALIAQRDKNNEQASYGSRFVDQIIGKDFSLSDLSPFKFTNDGSESKGILDYYIEATNSMEKGLVDYLTEEGRNSQIQDFSENYNFQSSLGGMPYGNPESKVEVNISLTGTPSDEDLERVKQAGQEAGIEVARNLRNKTGATA